MSKQEIFEALKDTWETYGEIENGGLTTSQLREVDNFLDDIERLISDD